MKIHELKTWPEYYQEIEVGNKTFEVRKNDRDYKVGDILHLREYYPKRTIVEDMIMEGYSGREMLTKVEYILQGGSFGIEEGYYVMSIKVIA